MSSCRQWKAKAQPPQAEHQPNLPARRAGNGFAEEASAAAPSGLEAPARQDGSSRRQRHRHQSAAWGSWSNYGYGYYETQDPTWSNGPWQSWPTWNPADGFSNSDWYAGPNTRRSGEFRAHRPQAQSVESIPESASADLLPQQPLRRSQRQSETPEPSFVPSAAAPDANDADVDDGSRPSSGFVETTTTPSAVAGLRPDALSAPTAAPPMEEEGEKEKVLSEEPRPRSWLTGAPDALAYIEDFLAQTNEPQGWRIGRHLTGEIAEHASQMLTGAFPQPGKAAERAGLFKDREHPYGPMTPLCGCSQEMKASSCCHGGARGMARRQCAQLPPLHPVLRKPACEGHMEADPASRLHCETGGPVSQTIKSLSSLFRWTVVSRHSVWLCSFVMPIICMGFDVRLTDRGQDVVGVGSRPGPFRASNWLWHDVLSYPWKQPHINVLELTMREPALQLFMMSFALGLLLAADMAEDLAEDREPPWYNVPYLLRYRFREPIADSSLEGLPSLGRRPKPAAPVRAPGRDLVAAIKDVSGEGLALGLSPLSAVASYGQAFAAGVSASGSWDKVELLPWSLLHPAGPPSWGEGREATVRWRFHVVDLRAKPTEFHAGNKNLLHLTDGTGNWEQTKLLPGILTVEICLQRSLPLHVQVGPCQQRDGQADEHEVRALVLADKLCLCLDHRRPETGLHCFCPEALLAAAAPLPAASEVVNWESTADYMASWRPAVELEAAASAADEDDTRTLSNVEIAWGEKGLGSFVVPSALASAHRMKMRGLIRGEDGPTEWSSGWLCLRLPAQQSGGIGWRGHAGIVDADLVGDDGNAQPLAVVVGEEEAQIPQTMSLRISFQMVPGASDSSGTPRTRKAGYIIEFIPKSLPYSCMAVALAELSSASPLLREVVLQARAPAPGASPGPAAAQRCLDDEASWHSETRESFAKSRFMLVGDDASWALQTITLAVWNLMLTA
eukprot:s2396_g1.t1